MFINKNEITRFYKQVQKYNYSKERFRMFPMIALYLMIKSATLIICVGES